MDTGRAKYIAGREADASSPDTLLALAGRGSSHITDRRSDFYGIAVPVSGAGEALDVIAGIKKANPGARHTAYAYIAAGSRGTEKRYSDDGEPQGTAGRPMLELLERAGLDGALVAVTRYFGGILLGTGGLYRAYSGAAAEALSDAGSVVMRKYALMRAEFGYDEWARTEKSLRPDICRIIVCEYSSSVTVSAAVTPEGAERFRAIVSDVTCGRSSPGISGYGYYCFTE
ncbi:MAG: YigZ family protein [Clostridia bacterium]|nr:YigZ family protein [Clostridia bacterium]